MYSEQGSIFNKMKKQLKESEYLKNVIKIYPTNILNWNSFQEDDPPTADTFLDEDVLFKQIHIFPVYFMKGNDNVPCFGIIIINWAYNEGFPLVRLCIHYFLT